MLKLKLLRICIASIFIFISFSSSAQIGIGISTPDSSAMLHVQDTARGLLIPRMTASQKNAIHNPAEGLMVYQTDSNKGFWYYTGSQWVSFDKSYKSVLYLTGDITDSEAAAKIAMEAGPSTQEIQITDCSLLTTVDLSGVASISKINITNNPLLQTVTFNDLKNIDLTLNISNCPALTALSLPLLEKVGNSILIQTVGAIDLAMPALQKIGIYMWLINSGIVNVSLPALTSVGNFLAISNTNISTLNLPALKKVTLISVSSNPNLLTAAFPVLTELNNPVLPSVSMRGNARLTSLDVPVLTKADNIILDGAKKCTSLNLPLLSTVKSLRIKNDSSLASISFPSLTSVTKALEIMDDSVSTMMGSQLFSFPLLASADSIAISRIKSTSISLPALTTVGNSVYAFTIASTLNLTSISLPALTVVGGGFSVSGHWALNTLSIPSLATVGGRFSVSNVVAITTFSAPALASVAGIEMLYDSLLIAVAFPALTTITGTPGTQYLYISSCGNLTSISIPALSTLNTSVIFSWNHLSSSEINALLNKLVSTSITNKIINTQYQSPLAPPTGQGLTDKATLQSRGNSVYTD